MTDSQPISQPNPLGLKLIIVGRRKPGTTLAEHRHHIRHVHGELVLKYIASEPTNAPQRYVQHQVIDGEFRATAVATDPFALNRDFVTQVWMQDFAALGRSRETAFYREHLMGDEDNFVDQANVVFMPVRERDMLPPAGATSAAAGCKLFFFHLRAGGVDPFRFASAWAAGVEALGDTAALRRYVQNDVLPRPGAPASPADAIDEFWLDDEAAARALLVRWKAWVGEALVATGLASAAGSFALLATETVLHAGPRQATM